MKNKTQSKPVHVITLHTPIYETENTEQLLANRGLLGNAYADYVFNQISWEYATAASANKKMKALKEYLRTKNWNRRKYFTLTNDVE